MKYNPYHLNPYGFRVSGGHVEFQRQGRQGRQESIRIPIQELPLFVRAVTEAVHRLHPEAGLKPRRQGNPP